MNEHRRKARELLDTPATPEMYQLAADTVTETCKNVDLLEADSGYNALDRYLYDWAIVLTILSLDIFETSILVLKAERFRAANILIRSLIEYGTRLRYYVVRSKRARAAFANDPTIGFERIRDQMDAAIDWDNGEYSLGKKLTKYDSEFWVDRFRERLVEIAEDPREPGKRSHTEMRQRLCHIQRSATSPTFIRCKPKHQVIKKFKQKRKDLNCYRTPVFTDGETLVCKRPASIDLSTYVHSMVA